MQLLVYVYKDKVYHKKLYRLMINKKVIIVTLLCMSVLSWTNSCPGFYAGDLLQSGKYQL